MLKFKDEQLRSRPEFNLHYLLLLHHRLPFAFAESSDVLKMKYFKISMLFAPAKHTIWICTQSQPH